MGIARRALAILGIVAPLAAQGIPLSGYAEAMSNYVGRGLAQSVGQPSVGIEFEAGGQDGLYADLDLTSINWVDQLHPGDSVSVEVDGLLAYRRHAGDWLWKAGLLRMQFPGRYVPQDPPVAEPHTTEAFVFLGWKGISARLNDALTDAFATPDSKGSTYLDLNAAQPLGRWTFSAHLGRKDTRGTDPATGLRNRRFSYTDYKVSVEVELQPGLSLAAAQTWTTADPDLFTLNGYRVAGPHLALTLKRTF